MPVYGPFHRFQSPPQSAAVARLQQVSGEIWGGPARWSNIPSVKAYVGSLPPGAKGVEFTTTVAPDPTSSTPLEARWYYPKTRAFT